MLDNFSLCYFYIINNSQINEGLAASVVIALLYTEACKLIFLNVNNLVSKYSKIFIKSLLIRAVTPLMTRQRISCLKLKKIHPHSLLSILC